MSLNDAAFATSLYFIFRTAGCLTGSFFLRVMNNRVFFAISVVMMALSMCGMVLRHVEGRSLHSDSACRLRQL